MATLLIADARPRSAGAEERPLRNSHPRRTPLQVEPLAPERLPFGRTVRIGSRTLRRAATRRVRGWNGGSGSTNRLGRNDAVAVKPSVPRRLTCDGPCPQQLEDKLLHLSAPPFSRLI